MCLNRYLYTEKTYKKAKYANEKNLLILEKKNYNEISCNLKLKKTRA